MAGRPRYHATPSPRRIREGGPLVNPDVQAALDAGEVIDITTTGRTSGQPRRIEIGFHNIAGRLYITGTPGPRSWYANLLANPDFTFHLKRSVLVDLPARARPITEADERREVLGALHERLDVGGTLEEWLASSPLVEVELEPGPAA
jgi:deazaflavin-dependent oxidoreductase (nitroreductase family)